MRGFVHGVRLGVPSIRSAAWLAVGLLVMTAAFAPVVGAASSTPSAGSATVDGDPGEWSLGTDLFADMAAGSQDPMGRLYLRYDCDTETLYGLVLTLDGNKAQQTRPAEAYLRIDGAGKLVSGQSGDDGTPPDFAWVGGDGTLADGFEASGHVAPGSHTIRAHVLIDDDSADGYTPIDANAPLELECAAPTEAPTPTPTGEVEPTATPTGSVDPVTGTPTPTAGVGGVAATPRVTLPPTDVAIDDEPASTSGLSPVLLILAAGVAAALILLPAPKRRTR